MDVIDAPQQTEKKLGPFVPQSQPVAALVDLDPLLDDNAVRQALAAAESKNQDPATVTLDDMAKGQSAVPEPVKPAPAELPKPEVPEKFLKPDGVVDVEKLQTSTRQLNEALRAKETAVQKTVDDYVREYRELEKKFSGTPNPEKLAAQLAPAPIPAQVPASLPQMTDQQLEELINKDIQANPGRTITQLIQLALDNRFRPIEEDRKLNGVRENLQQLATKDPRILQPEIYSAIKAKLDSDPDYWKLKNPHRAAWLDVKEELRLGDPATAGQAQPSRLPAPVLAGGTPPSTPSVSVSQQDVFANLDKVDLRDRRQEAVGDDAIRAFLSRSNR